MPTLPFRLFRHRKDGYAVTGKPTLKKKKSVGREWFDAVVFAVIVATLIRTLLIEAYTIPSGSMERSLLTGDYIFVSKLNYGPRMPITPLAFPFAHHSLPYGLGKAYYDGVKLPYYRLPGLQQIKLYDVVVFNWPADTESHRPVDKKENYIKRCQGMPGDTLQIINARVFLNGKPSVNPPEGQSTYRVKTNGTEFNPKTMQELGINGADAPSPDGTYLLFLTPANLTRISHFSNVTAVSPANEDKRVMSITPLIFPGDTLHKWNADFYGPVIIPARGSVIALDTKNIAVYARAIREYEGNKLEIRGSDILINGQKASSYTFKMNYYWMLGDNRHNSIDSRYWGFVPEDHIVGKALFVWWSMDKNGSGLSNIRWNRIFMGIK